MRNSGAPPTWTDLSRRLRRSSVGAARGPSSRKESPAQAGGLTDEPARMCALLGQVQNVIHAVSLKSYGEAQGRA
jgi:hypothetical protein